MAYLLKLAGRLAVVVLGAWALAACATGKSVTEAPEAQVPLAPGKARIAVYRTGILGAAVQPAVSVDGRKTGSCTPNGVFYVDVRPGKHEITASTEVTETLTVNAGANRVTYVECSIGIGFVVGRPKLQERQAGWGEQKVRELVFTGKF